MLTLSQELERIREYLKWLSEFDIKNETHPGGWKLGCSDAMAEEVLILLEMKRLYSEKVEQMYQEATKRAEERATDTASLLEQCSLGFKMGIYEALGHPLEIPSITLSLVKSETNFGFAFVCGVMSVLEAIKGKGYKASWQADGELSALPNIKRKYDRLKAMQGTLPGELALDESRPTTAADLAVYAAKLTTWFNEFDPEGFKAWIEEVKKLRGGANVKVSGEAKT